MRRLLSTTLRKLWQEPPRGVALVEFGLVAPLLIVLIVGVADLALLFYASLQVQGAAAAGAQYASNHAFNQSTIQSVVANTGSYNGIFANPVPSQVCGCTSGGSFSELGAPSSGNCSAYSCASGSGLYAKVQAQLVYSTLLPYPGLSSPMLLSGLAYRRIQ